MKTFVFAEKNSSAVIVLSAESFLMAHMMMQQLVKDVDAWRCDDEEGEEED